MEYAFAKMNGKEINVKLEKIHVKISSVHKMPIVAKEIAYVMKAG